MFIHFYYIRYCKSSINGPLPKLTIAMLRNQRVRQVDPWPFQGPSGTPHLHHDLNVNVQGSALWLGEPRKFMPFLLRIHESVCRSRYECIDVEIINFMKDLTCKTSISGVFVSHPFLIELRVVYGLGCAT
jgi:hypothetical protein